MKKTTSKDIKKLEKIAKDVRLSILNMIYKAKATHIGPSFSIVEILVALYFTYLKISPSNPEDKNRDRFILSKGHGCPALYSVLSQRGFIEKNILAGFSKDGGTLERHPTRNLKFGIEVSSGSLGHGLSIGAGMAIAARADKAKNKIFVLLGDGEINEGNIWEAAMLASHRRLDNLIAMIDYNKIQALGATYEMLNLEPLVDKWKSFGWGVMEVDGHNFEQIIRVLNKIPFEKNKPSVILLHTIKGKGISFMENNILWHYRCPNKDEYAKALKELS